MEITKELGIQTYQQRVPSQHLFDGSIEMAAFTGTWAGYNPIGAILDVNRPEDSPIIPASRMEGSGLMMQLLQQFHAVTRGAYVGKDGIVVALDPRLEPLARAIRTPVPYK